MRNTTFVALAASFLLGVAPNFAAASVIGSLSNFDVINDTGSTAHGFEIELEGLHPEDITDTFGGAGRGFPSGRGFHPSRPCSATARPPSPPTPPAWCSA